MEPSRSERVNYDELSAQIQRLEQRVKALEEDAEITRLPGLKSRSNKNLEGTISEAQTSAQVQDGEFLESKIGEYGMAWLGNIVLFFGIIFLTKLLHNQNLPIISILLGFTAVVLIYITGHMTRRSLPYMSSLFIYNGHILLFFLSMRIHFFSGSQIIENIFIGRGIVLLVIIGLSLFAIRNKSQLLSGIVLLMATVTAIASNSTHFMLALAIVISVVSFYFAARSGWWKLLVVSIFLVYPIFLIWILGYPLAGNSLEVRECHGYGHLYLFTCALVYSMLPLLQKRKTIPEHLFNASILLNGIGFSFIFTFAVLSFFTDNYYILFGLISAFCIVYSVILQYRGAWPLIAGLYALYGFVALSITIGGIYNFPLAFFLLAIQSLLVVSMALWFRSRFIVIMNTILFVGLLIAYLVSADSLNSINFSFALVALVTARIINWKKKRLEIKTELIRNLYLFTGFVMILYSLRHAVPSQYVTLSWILSALVFFILSLMIHNIKYRWLAITTMVVAAFHLFIFDLKNMGIGYRIIALLFLAAIALGFSIFYSRRLKKKKDQSS